MRDEKFKDLCWRHRDWLRELIISDHTRRIKEANDSLQIRDAAWKAEVDRLNKEVARLTEVADRRARVVETLVRSLKGDE